jgi:aerobic carbon-monoxide dehydrogenase medium subunit
MMLLPDFALVRPSSLEEAIQAVDEDHVPVVGGTELLLAMRMGMLQPVALVDLARIEEFGHVRVEGSELVIGAAVTHEGISNHPEVRDAAPLLADVEKEVGNARVRAQGSIGGNLCFAEPKSDVATALIALDASVVLQGPDGRRQESVVEFVEGPYTTTRDERELLIEVRVPVTSRRAVYRKFQTMERPTVGVAATSTDTGVAVVVGAIGGAPVRADFGTFAEVDVEGILDQLDPIPDLTGSEEYKLHVAGVEIRRALEAIS